MPDGVYEHFAAGVGARGAEARDAVDRAVRRLSGRSFPNWPREIDQMQRRELPAGWDRNLPVFPADPKGLAGRDASGKVLNVLAQNIPWFLGGSADLGPSNKTTLTFTARAIFSRQPGRKNLHFGIREHAMAAMVNGLVAVQAPGLRRDVLHLQRLRPARDPAFGPDGVADHFHLHARRHGRRRGRPDPPAGGATGVAARHSRAGHVAARRCQRSRRGLSLHHATAPPAGRAGAVAPAVADAGSRANMRRPPAWHAGPTCWPTRPGGNPEVILIATGSEVSLAVEAHERLLAEGIRSRVVSMPSWDIFEHQPKEYRDSVLPPEVTARVAVEQASTFGWERYVGAQGRIIGMKTFGASAPLKELRESSGSSRSA